MGVDAGNRWLSEAGGRSRTYDQRWEELAAAGQSVHGEADLVESLGPRSVLDAGCGVGGSSPNVQSNVDTGCAGTLFDDNDLNNRFAKDPGTDIVFSAYLERP